MSDPTPAPSPVATPPTTPPAPPTAPAVNQLKEWHRWAIFAALLVMAGFLGWCFSGLGDNTEAKELKTQLEQEKAARKTADEAKAEAEKKAAAVPRDQVAVDLNNQFTSISKEPDGNAGFWWGGYAYKGKGAVPTAVGIGGPVAPPPAAPAPEPTTDWSALLDDYQMKVAKSNGLDPAKMKEDDVRVFHIAVAKAKAEAEAEKVKLAAEEAKAKAEADLAKAKAEKSAEAVDELKKSLQAAEEAKAKAEAAQKKAVEELEQFKADKAKAESAAEKAKLEGLLEQSKGALDECERALKEVRDQLTRAQAEAADAKAKAETLERVNKSLVPPPTK